MDIMNVLYIMEMNDELYQRFKQSEHVINAKVKSVLRQISSLKYATHELYVPAPYQDELVGLPNGRIRKDVEERDCLKTAGLYSFGFSTEGRILCSQEAPENIENGIITKIYEYDKGRICKVHRYASCWGDSTAEEYNFIYDNNHVCAVVGEKRLKNGELDIRWKNKRVYKEER